MSEKFILNWNDFQENISKCFQGLRMEKELTDVTLVTDDEKQLKAHRVILSSCSNFFKNIFIKNTEKDLVLYLDGVSESTLREVLDYIYKGQAHIQENDLERFFTTANKLKLEGLMNDQFSEPEKPHLNQTDTETFCNNQINPKFDDPFYEASRIAAPNNRNDCIIMWNSTQVSSKDLNEELLKFLQVERDQVTCKKCGKISRGGNRRDDMNAHIERHLPEVSYKCSRCSKVCKTRNDMRSHKARTCKNKVKQEMMISQIL